MRIALAQMKNQGSVEANLNQSIEWMREAAEHGADLILFPEVQLTEFFPQYQGQDVRRYRLGLESPEVQAFRKASREWNIWASPNVYLEENGKAYDASLLIGADGQIAGIQKMVHIAQACQFYEQDYYTPSDDGFRVFDTPWGRIGIVVCFDRHYPESIRFHNSAAIAMCNRVGCEGEMTFSGESIVVDANGQVLARAGDAEELLYADVDMAASRRIRESRPYTGLRRPEFYV